MKKLATIGVLFFGINLLAAHPHISKVVTTQLPGGNEITVSYQSTPVQEINLGSAPVNWFLNPWAPLLRVSQDIESDGRRIEKGAYTVGLFKQEDGGWGLALQPGRLVLPRKELSDEMILLKSIFSTARGSSGHLVMDFAPGEGELEGKIVLTVQLGSIFVAGELG